MKLFVWSNPYPVPYGSSLLIVVARDVKHARKIAGSNCVRYSFNEYEQGRNDMQAVADTLGDPLRIVELPCAEWHDWRE